MTNEIIKTGIYIHWPFCLSKCPYCDFNTYVRQSVDESEWLEAYLKALDYYSYLLKDRPIATVFFGGGTPSLMQPASIEAIIDRIQRNFSIANDLEVTLEANPTTVETDKFQAFKQAGVNRVSIGVQSLRDKALQFLGRGHDVKEAITAIETAKKTFDRSSFDLIYARPEQTLEEWGEELDEALSLADGHMSLYQLTIETATPFYKAHQKGQFTMPKEELAADFYDLTIDKLGAIGLSAYEVSNHAREGQQAQHNLIYWNYDDYIGIGPGAHGRLTLPEGKVSTFDIRSPEKWLERVNNQGCGAGPFETLSPEDQFTEGFMMGMRLFEGLDVGALAQKTGARWQDHLDETKIKAAEEQGWVIANMSSWRKPGSRNSGCNLSPIPGQARDDNIGKAEMRLTATREGMLRLNGLLQFLIK